jgi:hypothetical protein
MNSAINWGLVIQGPIIGFGQGPNNSKSGFNAYEVIQKNIAAFAPYVENIVVSTWIGSGFNLDRGDAPTLIANGACARACSIAPVVDPCPGRSRHVECGAERQIG